MSALRRDHYHRTYMLRVCPYHGHAKAGCCEREPIVIEAVPVERLREVERARDVLSERYKALAATRQVVFTIKGATLYGCREAVGIANAAVAALKATAA